MKVLVFIGTNGQECNKDMKKYLFTYFDLYFSSISYFKTTAA